MKFSKDHQPKAKNRKGGRRRTLKKVITELGAEAFLTGAENDLLKKMKKRFGGGKFEVTQQQWQDMMVGMSELSREELTDIASNKDTPIGIGIIATSLLAARNKGNPENMMTFFARKYGKTIETINNNSKLTVIEEKKEYTEAELVEMAKAAGLPTDIFEK